MARYRYEIKTADVMYAGTDANVFMSLSGDKATLKETELNDPDPTTTGKKGRSITAPSRRRTRMDQDGHAQARRVRWWP